MSFDEEIEWDFPVVDKYRPCNLSLLFSLLSMCSRGHVTTQLSPEFLLTQFLTQPEVKFHIFKWLKHGEGKSLQEKFFRFSYQNLK